MKLSLIIKLTKLFSNQKVQEIFTNAFTELGKEKDVMDFIQEMKTCIQKKKTACKVKKVLKKKKR